jgi:putative tryptophan/tyrosine transport system substrate-binding protein
MRRREFISVVGSTVAWPLAARAQQPMPVIGLLHTASPATIAELMPAFRKGLAEAGYVDGQNVTIDDRLGENRSDLLEAQAADLVRRRVAVIVTPISTSATLAAQAATSIIPIVFLIGADPTNIGLATSFSRPGGNATGISDIGVELGAKRVALVHELLPRAIRFAALVNPNNPQNADPFVKELQTAGSAVGRQIDVVAATTNSEINTAFAAMLKMQVDGFLISPDALFFSRRVQLVTLATRHALPGMYHRREFADAGGLMSYGSSVTDQFRQIGNTVGRVLKGEKPADMPIQRPTKFELVVNLQTAKALGIEIPPALLARADEVIE